MQTDSYQTGPIDVGHRTGSFRLDVPNMAIPRGKVTVIVGENGAGKSTLLKYLAGLTDSFKSRGGSHGLDAIRDDATYLHQTPYLFRGTVARNLLLVAKAARRGRPDTSTAPTLDLVLDAVGLHYAKRRRATSLSGGEFKRAAIARLLLTRQPLFLLDEPAANSDEKSQRMIESVCRKLAESGKTVVVATHRSSFAYRVADGLYVLRDGRIEPSSANILRGEVVKRDGGFLHFRTGSLELRAPVRDGTYTTAVVLGEDILLSQAPLNSSARNSIVGTLADLRRLSAGTLLARLECGATLSSVITDSAAADLGLQTGNAVYITFKASAVGLY